MYAVVLTIGVLAGGFLLLFQSDPDETVNRLALPVQIQVQGYLAVCFCGLAGARIAHLLIHRHPRFEDIPGQLLGGGGLSWEGAVVAGLAALGVFVRLSHTSFLRAGRRLLIPFLIVHLAARLGWLLTGGQTAMASVPPTLPWALEPIHADFIVATSSALLPGVLLAMRDDRPQLGLAATGAAIIQLFATLVSTRPVLLIASLRLDTAFACAALLLSLTLLILQTTGRMNRAPGYKDHAHQ